MAAKTTKKKAEVAVKEPKAPQAPLKFHLTEAQMGEFYRFLKTKTFMQSAIAIGLDKHYATSSLVPTTQKIAAMVRLDPEKYGITPKEVVEIDYAIRERNVRTSSSETALEKRMADDNQSFKNVLEETRMGLLDIVHRKVKRLGRSNKKIDEANLGTLVTSLAIMIDKLQLIRGEATENVAVLAKIDQNISPEAALDMILKMRETNLESKNHKK